MDGSGDGGGRSGGSTWRAAGLRPGLLGWWRSSAASSRRPAGRPAEAGPRPPLKGAPAAAQPLLSSHSQTAPARGPRRHGRGSRVAGAAGGGPQQGELPPSLTRLEVLPASLGRVYLFWGSGCWRSTAREGFAKTGGFPPSLYRCFPAGFSVHPHSQTKENQTSGTPFLELLVRS